MSTRGVREATAAVSDTLAKPAYSNIERVPTKASVASSR